MIPEREIIQLRKQDDLPTQDYLKTGILFIFLPVACSFLYLPCVWHYQLNGAFYLTLSINQHNHSNKRHRWTSVESPGGPFYMEPRKSHSGWTQAGFFTNACAHSGMHMGCFTNAHTEVHKYNFLKHL